MCEGQLGNAYASIEAHDTAGRVDPTFKETFLNSAQMYKEIGKWREAESGFRNVIKMDSTKRFHQGPTYMAQLLYGCGRPAEALEFLRSGMKMLPGGGDIATFSLAASACLCLGKYRDAVTYFDRALRFEADCSCWFQREISLYMWSRLDKPLSAFSIDDELDPRVKDGWCKRAPWRAFMAPANDAVEYTPMRTPDVPTVDIDKPAATADELARRSRLLDLMLPLNSWVQLNCQGFLPNATQHCMFGLAVLNVAQCMRKHCSSIRADGPGLDIDDATSSRAEYSSRTDLPSTGSSSFKSPGKSSAAASTPASLPATSTGGSNSSKKDKEGNGARPGSEGTRGEVGGSNSSSGGSSSSGSSGGAMTGKRGSEHQHLFGWRDLFDIAVRWRQVSEPNDPVWWIDRLPAKAFTEGFGLQVRAFVCVSLCVLVRVTVCFLVSFFGLFRQG